MNPERPILLASIHDVSPRFEGEIDRLLDLLAPHVGERLAMLVVPNHWSSAPIVPGSPFAARLRGWADAGLEIFLHGLIHRDNEMRSLKSRFMTAGEGEFLGLDRVEAIFRICSGRSLLEDIIGRPVDGFVAPAWLYGPGALEALTACEIPIAEDHFRVWSPTSGKELARSPVITWASRTRMRLSSSLAAAAALRHLPFKVLRIGVHPPDVRHPSVLRSVDATFTAALRTRVPAAYASLNQGEVRIAG